jgi:ribosomal protein S18 acetylase RimI-like enzyme
MQRKGIGTRVIRTLLDVARQQGRAVTLAVMKINPALAPYERFGFRITHEDEYKFYMRADPRTPDVFDLSNPDAEIKR